jgi:uncharacterized protein
VCLTPVAVAGALCSECRTSCQPDPEPERVGDWMQTYTGRAFWPLDPRPEEIDPLDIAHALGMLCRYGGHVRRFYSVAEHCVLMSRAVAPEFALWALLHDATEAYLVDVPRPIKHYLPDYVAIEHRLMAVICERFGLDATEPPEVKDADNRILLDERAKLLKTPPRPWAPEIEGLQPLGVRVTGWGPRLAQRIYLDRLNELGVSP